MLLVTLLAFLASAQGDVFSELGIPVAPPSGARSAARAAAEAAPRHPLLGRDMAADLADVRAWGRELDAVLARAAARPQVFPPRPVEPRALFDEYREEAAAAWARALDLLLALDSAEALYGSAPRLGERKARARALAVLGACRDARARFMRRWSAYAERDPALRALFDEPAPELGLGPGAFSRLSAAKAGPVFAPRSSALRAASPAEAPERPRLPLLLPPLEGDVSVSSRVGYAVGTLRHWFRLDASTSLVPPSREQLSELARRLEPGDIVLVRRSASLGSVGQGGWWDGAGVYLGSDAERRALTGDDSLSALLRAAAPQTAPASSAAARVDLPSVAAGGRDGVRVLSLALFAAADAAGVLRPRRPAEERAEAVARAARLAGKALSEGGVIAAAYAGLPDAPNDLARRFDARFGTDEQDLDFIGAIAPGGEADERRMPLEAFRAAWRRPRWEFAPDKESTP